MNELIGKIRQWGVDRYICGPEGEGTLGSQLSKAQEELQEAFDALYDDDKHEIADAIGDVTVCLVLAAERAGLIFEDCVEQATAAPGERRRGRRRDAGTPDTADATPAEEPGES